MLYQKILTDGRPYELILSEFGVFSEHRHADMNLITASKAVSIL